MINKYLGFCVILIFRLSVTDAGYAKYVDFVTNQALNETFVHYFEEHVKLFEDISTATLQNELQCNTIKEKVSGAKTVHNLTPMDIKVIGAMGDSLTAGTGIEAKTVLGLLNQYRGLSWSIGGDASLNEYQTLPNIIKQFSPNVTGYSLNKGKVDSKYARLNVAVPGNKSRDMPGQAKLLVERMKADPNIDMENDWKIITLFIGGNDLCDYCEDQIEHSTLNYMQNIQSALDTLHEEVPKAFVNLVEVLNIANIDELNRNLVCNALHLYGCACGAYPEEGIREKMQEAVKDYQDSLHLLTDSGRYDTRDDFTVVVQPFFRETTIPKKSGTDDTDLSFFAPDCFHFSLKGQEAAAIALWKNMMEPVGYKTKTWTPGESPVCPSEDFPYFYTNQNSKFRKTKNQFGSQFNGGNPIMDAKPSHNSSPQDTPTTVEIVAAVAGVCVICLVVTVSIVILKRRKSNMESKQLLMT